MLRVQEYQEIETPVTLGVTGIGDPILSLYLLLSIT